MDKKKRTVVAILSGVGWAVSVGIVAGSLTEVIAESAFFGRLFALTALLSAVGTLGLWFDTTRSRRQVTLPVETAYSLGMQQGFKLCKIEVPADGPDDPLIPFGKHLGATLTQHNTPPRGW